MKTKLYALLILIVTIFTSCDIQDVPIDQNLPVATGHIMVLSEGGYGQNNSTLACYDLNNKTSDNNFFATKNSRGLGDLANDMIKYGSKIYIVVNGSSQIEVINANTGESEKQIPMFNGTSAKQPRYIVSYKNKVYVSSYDNTVTRIDTTTLNIDGSVIVGRNPEQLCVAGDKLYVTNSGGLDFPNFDNTVSVIDLSTFTETTKITVGLNPTKIKADGNGNLFVVCNGNYSTDLGEFQKIDTKTNTVTTISDVSAYNFTIYNNMAYFYEYGDTAIKVYDCVTEKITNKNFISDATTFPDLSYIYSINVDAYNGDVYISTTDYKTNGNVYCFDKDGKLKYELVNVGLNPNTVLFLE